MRPDRRFEKNEASEYVKTLVPILCQCGCGETLVPLDSKFRPRRFLPGHNSKGPLNHMYGKKRTYEPNPYNGPIPGDRIGRLIVLCVDPPRKHRRAICRCDCGTMKSICVGHLMSGKTQSCGCLHAERIAKHGCCDTRLYSIWTGMKQRCTNANEDHYKYYGGRGISVCKQWVEDFNAFKEWALGNGYSAQLTLDRINVNGNYCPENCRWADWDTQRNNTRRSRLVTAFGETKTIGQWAHDERCVVSQHVLRSRVTTCRWIPEDAITTGYKAVRKYATRQHECGAAGWNWSQIR